MIEPPEENIDLNRNVATSSEFARVLVAILVFTLLCAYVLAKSHTALESPLRQTDYPGDWISAAGEPSHAGYFRKRFDLSSQVKHAWIKIAATDAFEVSVNRNPLGRVYLWRPTRPFQNGTSEKGQVLLPAQQAMALNFPREYQWNGHDTWRVPVYVELTSSFQQGKNVICIETESRSAPARVSFAGEIQLWNGDVIPICSDESWLAESSIPGPQLLDWTELYYWDKEWRNAKITDGPVTKAYRSVPPQVYDQAFQGNWIRHPKSANRSGVTFRSSWEVDGPVDEAWIRLLANRKYELRVNGKRVRAGAAHPELLDNGEWTLDRRLADDPSSKPELLDPDEVGSSFIGQRFQSPREGQRSLGEFRNPFSPQLTPFRYIRTYNRAQDPGVWDPKRTLAESRRTPETPDLFPDSPRPNSLKRDLAKGGYYAYSIAALLKEGVNEIEVECFENGNASWPTQIAVDGGATMKNGTPVVFVNEHEWQAVASNVVVNGELAESKKQYRVQVLGPVAFSGKALPSLYYRGSVRSSRPFVEIMKTKLQNVAPVSALMFLLFTGFTFLHGRLALVIGRVLTGMLLVASTVLFTAILLECSWVERHEYLWFLDGSFWRGSMQVAAIASAVTGLVLLDPRSTGSSTKLGVWQTIQELPNSKIWFHMCIWVLLLGALLRSYKLDLQPLDDDEYASTQAIMSILETGVPGFEAESVYYTRSPLFHYLTAAVAWPFSGNLWSLRLQSVFWSLTTAWLLYLCGAHLLNSRWIGFIAMTLLCIHPFQIFTGHVVRFYQMQQFFALLTVYCFCRGFVAEQSQRYRVATLFVFLMAVLSQEISVAIGPSLLFGYLMFAKDLGWQKNLTLLLISVAVVAIVALDLFIFQTLCLTRTEGVSPTIQSTVKPHFWYPMNFLSLFIGYSRLHIVPSCFLLLAAPLIWQQRNRNSLAMLWFLLSGIVLTNLLVTNVSLRYMYWLFPLWMLLSVQGIALVSTKLGEFVVGLSTRPNGLAFVQSVCGVACFCCVVLSWSPWRIVGSYELRILGDSTGAVRWVKSQKRPGDKIAITEPHTHCAFIEGGKCDYDIAIPLLYDFAVMQDGILVDRNGGGEVVSNVDQLISEIAKGERIWVLLNREKFRTRGKNMRWEYPGARFETFVRKNFELKHRTYLWSVFLWDPARGHYLPFRLQE